MLYLTYEDDDVGISILTFLPQVTSSLQHFFVGPERSTLNNLVDPARLGRWKAFGFGGLDVAVRTKLLSAERVIWALQPISTVSNDSFFSGYFTAGPEQTIWQSP